MELIKEHGAHAGKLRVVLQAAQQDALRHHLDARRGGDLAAKGMTRGKQQKRVARCT